MVANKYYHGVLKFVVLLILWIVDPTIHSIASKATPRIRFRQIECVCIYVFWVDCEIQ